MDRTPRHGAARVRRGLAACVVAALMLAGCSSNGDREGSADPSRKADATGKAAASGKAGGDRILRYHERTSAPDSMNPARGGGGFPWAYDVLIRHAADGSFQPQLAESWRYVGEGNRTFELKLRPGVKFTDGTPLTAEAVKANIEYRLDPKVGSQSAVYLANVTEVQVIDELTLRLNLAQPDPTMPILFSQGQGGPGMVISPAALKDPDILATQTAGAGPYKLDKAETQFGDHYTYIPDPNYWNRDAAVWDKVVVQYLPEESAALAALRSGQLDAQIGTSAIASSAEKAGLKVLGPGYPIVLGFSLMDREGKTVPALGDIRVRQALNYAVNRDKIAKALVGDAGRGTDQLAAPGQGGWNDEGFYPYDPDRAKQLLAEAGYADGFTLPVITPRSDNLVRMTAAVADDLSKIGVKLNVKAVAEGFDQADDATNRKYGAVLLGWGIDPPYRMGRSFWLPKATNNAWDSSDETLIRLDQQAAAADERERPALERQIIARVAELGWFLPVLIQGEFLFYDDEGVGTAAPWVDYASVPFSYMSELRPAG